MATYYGRVRVYGVTPSGGFVPSANSVIYIYTGTSSSNLTASRTMSSYVNTQAGSNYRDFIFSAGTASGYYRVYAVGARSGSTYYPQFTDYSRGTFPMRSLATATGSTTSTTYMTTFYAFPYQVPLQAYITVGNTTAYTTSLESGLVYVYSGTSTTQMFGFSLNNSGYTSSTHAYAMASTGNFNIFTNKNPLRFSYGTYSDLNKDLTSGNYTFRQTAILTENTSSTIGIHSNVYMQKNTFAVLKAYLNVKDASNSLVSDSGTYYISTGGTSSVAQNVSSLSKPNSTGNTYISGLTTSYTSTNYYAKAQITGYENESDGGTYGVVQMNKTEMLTGTPVYTIKMVQPVYANISVKYTDGLPVDHGMVELRYKNNSADSMYSNIVYEQLTPSTSGNLSIKVKRAFPLNQGRATLHIPGITSDSDLTKQVGASGGASSSGPIITPVTNTVTHTYQIDARGCTGCGSCEQACPTAAIFFDGSYNNEFRVDTAFCVGCRRCVEACPYGSEFIYVNNAIVD